MIGRATDQAFPQPYDAYSGITVREYFAAVALQGLLACENLELSPGRNYGMIAVKHADDLIKALGEHE